MISNTHTAKIIKQEKGYRIVMGGEVGRKHCLTRADASRHIVRLQQGLARFESAGYQICESGVDTPSPKL